MSADDKAPLKRLFHYAPTLTLVYAFHESLFVIFESPYTAQQAQQELKTWMFLVQEQRIPGFDAFLKTLETYWTPITNFFKQHLTRAFVEGLNAKICAFTRRCFDLFKYLPDLKRVL